MMVGLHKPHIKYARGLYWCFTRIKVRSRGHTAAFRIGSHASAEVAYKQWQRMGEVASTRTYQEISS